MIPICDVMNFLIENRADGLEPKVLADLFDRMIWILRDNGGELLKVRDAWMNGEDPFRVEIALLMSEVAPFSNSLDMEENLSKIITRWPKFINLCEQVRRQWGRKLR